MTAVEAPIRRVRATQSGGRLGARIAFIAANFWPEPTGSGLTVGEFARYLAARGADVQVATTMPWYPQWRISPQYRGRLRLIEHHAGMTIRRSWHLVAPRPSVFARLLLEATAVLFGLPDMVRVLWRADCAIIVVPLLGHAFVASLLASLRRVRLILVVKDILPDEAVALGMLPDRFVISLARRLVRWTYALADEIHTLSEGMRRLVIRDAGAGKLVRIVPDTIDADELRPVPSSANEFRRRFVPPGAFAVVHAGNMGEKQDLDLVLRTAELLRGDPGVRFLVFGDGARKDRFLEQCRKRGLQNVEHHPLQERWLLPHILSGADLLLVSQLAAVVDILMPSKLVTALGAGAMVVGACAADSETAKTIGASGGGLVIPPGDAQALAAQIERLRSDVTSSCGYRSRGRAFALRVFDRDAVYGPLADAFVGAPDVACPA